MNAISTYLAYSQQDHSPDHSVMCVGDHIQQYLNLKKHKTFLQIIEFCHGYLAAIVLL